MDTFLHDLRYAMRGLIRNTGMTVVGVLCLGLGIGANAVMFGVVDALMFKPPAHVVRPAGLVRICMTYHNPSGASGASPITGYGTYEAFRDNVRGFREVAAYWPNETTIGRGENARPLDAVLVTASFFRALGTQPALGRFFGPDEDGANAPRTVVLGYALWKNRFNGDPKVLDRTVTVGAQLYTVIGVAPEEFTGIDLKAVDAWLPISAATTMFAPNALTHDGNYWLSTFARLPEDASRAAVEAQATAAFAAEHAQEPWQKGTRVVFAPLAVGRGPEMSANTKVSLWLAGVSLIVLLIACANVANLLLARAVARSREVAVRLSLGAGRWRIARQLLTESMALAVLGMLAALVLTVWTSALVRRVLIPDVPLLGHAISLRVLAFAAVAALGTGLACGLAPAFVTMRSDLNAVLRGHARGRRERFLVQRGLVAGQVALTVMLLAGAGLFVRSLHNVRGVDVGMDISHTLYAHVDFAAAGVSKADGLARYHEMLERVRAIPGVTQASISIGEPFWSGWGTSIIPTSGSAASVKQTQISPMGRAVSAQFFAATGRRFVAGRSFMPAEHAPTSHAVIINQAAAHYYWPHESALGACIKTERDNTSCSTIVGVVADGPQYRITAPHEQELYVPIETEEGSRNVPRVSMMEVRTASDPHAMIEPVGHAMQSVGADIPYPLVTPLTDQLDPQYRPWKLGADMFSGFGLLALVLAAVGLYGVLTYAVAQRTRELGIRAALGAPRGALMRTVVVSGLTTVGVGAAIGVAGALGAGRFIASLLYGVSARDPWSLGAGAGLLIVIATAATVLPARRAARVDPMIALQAE